MTNDKTDRIINRILEVDNFQNMAWCCDDFSDFVTEILEWGVDHIAGVDFFDSYKSFRDFTFNPELDIEKLDAFISNQYALTGGHQGDPSGFNLSLPN